MPNFVLSSKYNHELVDAKWNDGEGKWHLSLKMSSQGGEILKDTADVDQVLSSTSVQRLIDLFL
jgi:hypothetical protein